MTIKIKVSYEAPGELLLIKRELQSLIDKYNATVKYADKGKYNRMYVIIEQGKK